MTLEAIRQHAMSIRELADLYSRLTRAKSPAAAQKAEQLRLYLVKICQTIATRIQEERERYAQ